MKLDINIDRAVKTSDIVNFINSLVKPSSESANLSQIQTPVSSQVQSRNSLEQMSIARTDTQSVSEATNTYKPDKKLFGEELSRAVQFLPQAVIEKLEREIKQGNIKPQDVEEIQVDLGRHVRIDLGSKNNSGTPKLFLVGNPADKADDVLKIKEEDLLNIQKNIMFNRDSGRGGIKGLEDLSRFSISEREAKPANITIRIGKALDAPLPDEMQKIILDAVTNKKKVLFLGQTGVGKTTLIRQISRFLSDKGISPSIFDKSEEISGHGATPHSILGQLARRFGIQPSKNVSQSLIQMIENHNPKVLIIDELSDREQFSGVRRTIDEKGIPTAFIFTHGTTLGKGMHSDNIKELLAKLETVIVGDDTAEKTGSGNIEDKIRHNVVGHSMIDIVVEMPAREVFVVHENAHESMKHLAAGEEPKVAIYPRGTNIRDYRSKEAEQFIEPKRSFNPTERPMRSSQETSFTSKASHTSKASQTSSVSPHVHQSSIKQPKTASSNGANSISLKKDLETKPAATNVDNRQYPILASKANYSKNELDSIPQTELKALQEELLKKKKSEGILPKAQAQLLMRVNTSLERRAEQGQRRVQEHYNKYQRPLNPKQEDEINSLYATLDRIKTEENAKTKANTTS